MNSFEKNIKNKLRSATPPLPASDADWAKVNDAYKKATQPEKHRRGFFWFFIGFSAMAISATAIYLLSDKSESTLLVNAPIQKETKKVNPPSAQLKSNNEKIETNENIYINENRNAFNNKKQNYISPIKRETKKEIVKKDIEILNSEESSINSPKEIAITTDKKTLPTDAGHITSPLSGNLGGPKNPDSTINHKKPTVKINPKKPKPNKFSLSFETGITAKNTNFTSTDTAVKISSENMRQSYMNLKLNYELHNVGFSSGLGYLHNTLQATYSQHVLVSDSFPVYNTQGQIIGYGHNLPKDSNITKTTTQNLHYIQIPIAVSYRKSFKNKIEAFGSLNCNLNFNMGYNNLVGVVEPIKTNLPASLTSARPLYINWQAHIGMAYTLSKKIKIEAGPYIYVSQNTIYKNANDKFKGAGFQFSLRYKL